jgi:hypothetical protein
MDRDTPACLPSTYSPPRRGGQPVVQAALVGLATLGCVAAVVAVLESSRCSQALDSKADQALPAKVLFEKFHLFQDWDRPSVVLMLSGEMHGYLQPCGCSKPQFGGLTRRYNFLQQMKELGWPVVSVDLGDLPQRSGPQALLKYEYAMKALNAMNYAAIGVGEYETHLFLPNVMGAYALNNPTPRVLAGNIVRGDDFKDTIFDRALAGGQGGAPKVGVVSLISLTVEKKIKKEVSQPPQFDVRRRYAWNSQQGTARLEERRCRDQRAALPGLRQQRQA